MSETWLRPGITDAMVRLLGYTLHRCDREGRTGGGVAFYLSDMLRAVILKSSTGSPAMRPEFIIAEILFKDTSKLLLAVVYRPPNSGYLDEFFLQFLDFQADYRHSIILGDFNADMHQCTFDSHQLNTFVTASGLYLVPFGSTHHLRNSSTLLDLCIIDDSDKLVDYGQHEVALLSAHDLVYIKYGVRVERRLGRCVVCRDWRNFDETAFHSDIRDIDWTSLFTSCSMDEKIEIFNSKLLGILDSHAPLMKRHFKNLPAP
ncbi:reverse transcriptase-9 [Lasius niger]|uniref:Reverse transcriptase-9 n=1 Tax=Lasius niger TaxID=67767 RepID=A0A0J7K0U9_LASNI|nr:reverse transcriptase-9 [Lasius niger]